MCCHCCCFGPAGCCCCGGAATKYAPKQQPVTILCCDIAHYDLLLARLQADATDEESAAVTAGEMITTYHRIVRQAIDKHKAYEVKHSDDGGAFMIALQDPYKAVCLAQALQQQLLAEKWGEDKLRAMSDVYQVTHPQHQQHAQAQAQYGKAKGMGGGGEEWGGESNNASTSEVHLLGGPEDEEEAERWRGLLVRIGMHSGPTVIVKCQDKEDKRGDTSRYDYCGLVPQLAASTAALARGGEVLLTDATYSLMSESDRRRVDVEDVGIHRLRVTELALDQERALQPGSLEGTLGGSSTGSGSTQSKSQLLDRHRSRDAVAPPGLDGVDDGDAPLDVPQLIYRLATVPQRQFPPLSSSQKAGKGSLRSGNAYYGGEDYDDLKKPHQGRGGSATAMQQRGTLQEDRGLDFLASTPPMDWARTPQRYALQIEDLENGGGGASLSHNPYQSTAPLFQTRQRPFNPNERISPCFLEGNGLMFRIVNTQTNVWSFFNDTDDLTFVADIVLGRESQFYTFKGISLPLVGNRVYEGQVVVPPGAEVKVLCGAVKGYKIKYSPEEDMGDDAMATPIQVDQADEDRVVSFNTPRW